MNHLQRNAGIVAVVVGVLAVISVLNQPAMQYANPTNTLISCVVAAAIDGVIAYVIAYAVGRLWLRSRRQA